MHRIKQTRNDQRPSFQTIRWIQLVHGVLFPTIMVWIFLSPSAICAEGKRKIVLNVRTSESWCTSSNSVYPNREPSEFLDALLTSIRERLERSGKFELAPQSVVNEISATAEVKNAYEHGKADSQFMALAESRKLIEEQLLERIGAPLTVVSVDLGEVRGPSSIMLEANISGDKLMRTIGQQVGSHSYTTEAYAYVNVTVFEGTNKRREDWKVDAEPIALEQVDRFLMARKVDALADKLVEDLSQRISQRIIMAAYKFPVSAIASAQTDESGTGSVQSVGGTSVVPLRNLTSKNGNHPVADKWALIVGVSQFKDSRVPKLRYSAKDARDFREYLVKEAGFAPDHVRLLVNEQATEKRVMSEIGDKFIARVAKPDDLVVLYFSTHGSPAAADLRQKNYVLAYDTEVDNLFATGIEMQKILDIIKDRANSGRVLLVLDACHSGAAGPGAKAFGSSGNFDAEALAQGSGQLVICSSQPNERSWESSRYDNGIFTRKLLDGLRINGKATKLGDAFEYVKKSVAAEAREAHGASQSPVLRSKWDGNDLMIACPATAPSAVPPEVKAGLQADSLQIIPARQRNPKSSPTGTRSVRSGRESINGILIQNRGWK